MRPTDRPEGPERQRCFDRSYNERLFESGGLRSFFHSARFKWLKEETERLKLSHLRLVEIGCFDGRLFDEIGSAITEYVGLDANWEGGLDLARERLGHRPDVNLIETRDPSPLRQFPDGHFTAAAALETLEHVPPAMVGAYLDELARVTRGRLFVTVPNEIGPVFLSKYIAKRLVYGGAKAYSLTEIAAATAGRSHLVARDEHKGFDYRKLVDEIAERFKLESVRGVPNLGMPPFLSLTVAIVASTR